MAIKKLALFVAVFLGCHVFAICFSSAETTAMTPEACAVQVADDPQANWGRLLDLLWEHNVALEFRTDGSLPQALSTLKLLCLGVNAKAFLAERYRILAYVKNGGHLIAWFMDDERFTPDLLPYRITVSDRDSRDIIFVQNDSPLLNDLRGRKFTGKVMACDVVTDYDAEHWRVLAETSIGPALLHARYGSGEILFVQFHTSLGNNLDLMSPFVENLIRWAGLRENAIKWKNEPEAVIECLLQRKPPESWAWNWGEGTLMVGLLAAYRATRDGRCLNYVKAWANFHLERRAKPKHYCGTWGPGLALLQLYEMTNDARYLRGAREIADFILNEAGRTADGGIEHYRGSKALWDDTLYMMCPLLAKLSGVTGEPRYADEAAKQLHIHANRLRDEKTGLFYHAWQEKTGEHSPCFWGRGNGWVLMSLVDTIPELPPGHPERPSLLKLLGDQARGIRKTQNSDGRWRTVLDAQDAYVENSASAMFVYGLRKADALLDESYGDVVQRGWSALEKNAIQSGSVIGVSAGTGPGNRENYQKRPTGVYPWGTGAFLMAMEAVGKSE